MDAALDAPRPSALREVLDTAMTLIQALAIAMVLRIVVFQPYTIPSESMEPGLLKGDYIFVSMFSYGWSRFSIPFGPPLFHGRLFGKDPARGDVVVFALPREPNVTYIKRLIGLPGDRVRVVGGVVYVNGVAIPRTAAGPVLDPGAPSLTVMQYRETTAAGKAYTTFDRGPGYPNDDTGVYVVPAAHYFMMGDNRDNSLDSRWPRAVGVGLVPAENLIGKAQMILMSWSDGASIFKPWTWFTHAQPQRAFHRLQ